MSVYAIPISTQGQITIPKVLRKLLGIEGGSVVIALPHLDEGEIIIKPAPKNWVREMRGLGKEVWKNFDTDKWLKKQRESWDR